MGRDILSNADGLVILNDRSWITEKGFYDASTNKFTKTTDEEYPMRIFPFRADSARADIRECT